LNAYLERANAAVKQGDPETILTTLKASISATTDNAHMLSGLGYISALAGRPSEALIFLEKAETTGGNEVDIFNTRAIIYLNQEQYKKALEAAEKATTANPENSTAWRLKAQAHEHLGEIEDAIECYKNSLNRKEDIENILVAPVVSTRKKKIQFEPERDDFESTYLEEERNESNPNEMDDFGLEDDEMVPSKKSSARKETTKETTSADSFTIPDVPETRTRRRPSNISDDSFGEERGRGGKNDSRKRGLIIN